MLFIRLKRITDWIILLNYFIKKTQKYYYIGVSGCGAQPGRPAFWSTLAFGTFPFFFCCILSPSSYDMFGMGEEWEIMALERIFIFFHCIILCYRKSLLSNLYQSYLQNYHTIFPICYLTNFIPFHSTKYNFMVG